MRGTSTHAVFRYWFGLTDAEAHVLAELYRAGGCWREREELAAASLIAAISVKRHVSCVRNALDAEAIDSAPRHGYRLTESGLGECRAALWKTGEELRCA